MICSYCQKDGRMTGEHIIPQALLDMFPECDFNIRYDKEIKYFKSENIVINDVCDNCNNVILSELDSYGSGMVRDYFVNTYEAEDKLVLPYNYSLLSRWLLKIMFNIARTKKSEIQTTSFESNLDYILGRTETSAMPISVFGGLSVDMTPLPEFFFDNMKLGVFFNPIFVKGSLIELVNPLENEFRVNKEKENMEFKKLLLSCVLRFGSGMFLVLLWEEEITPTEKQTMERLIEHLYPYALLKSDFENTTIKRSTHAYNYHHYYIIDTSAGLSMADQTNSFLPTRNNPSELRKTSSVEWDQHVTKLRENRASKRQKERDRKRKRKNKKVKN
ncbi:hypothetical protein AB1K89_05925 [Sporosarcina sp. 179-K 8C2 HS]|uniref:hypothetical protein n=1 Tax=Sporosarcina sp. 179-K 8C2 HS TaxID=3142387 RepID=UPI0039A3E7B3